MDNFLFQATIYLGAAVIAVPIAARLGLGSVLGYLAAGIVIGPVLHLVGHETEELRHFAEFGVVMMLFIIGLELTPRALWDMRRQLIGLGGAQVVGSTLAIMLGGMLLGLAWQTALAVGMILALSSTAIILQTLNEKGLMRTPGGRSAFSVLLTQDIAVIPMLAILPLLTLPVPPSLTAAGEIDRQLPDEAAHGTMSLVEGLPGWGVTLVTLGAVATVILVGVFLTRPFFQFISRAKLREIFTATALLMVVAIAFLMTLVGLSPALGTFVAGVVLANTEFRHQLEADVEPFKGLLLGLFFITVGAGIQFGVLFSNFFVIVGITLAFIAVKGAVLYGLALLFRLRGRDKWMFTLGLAQAGEFGFVLISFSTQQNVLPDPLGEHLLLAVALSMLLTPLAFILNERFVHRHEGGEDGTDEAPVQDTGPVIIAGIGRFGQVVNRVVQMAGLSTTVLDHDLETIRLMRRFGFKGFFGDPTRPELLHAAGLQKARVLVVALDDKDAAVKLVQFARKERPDLHIVARAYDRMHVYRLYAAGANDIVREMFDSSLRAGRYVLENMDFSEFEANELEKSFYRLDRHAMRELASLWKPDVPVSKNHAYIERARELNRDLETALVTRPEDSEEIMGTAKSPPAR
ncbi:cation:proton antiporter [Alphaproteobacteria bacterium KMM 3653]|uniref:Cation:proton antiporter n=1 Tax=Harenicola maris TaxID=2841044 RepID=A0AAP2CQM2_9RHOB|nr:cation:proton antiporter [Harenicola maris]